MRVVELAPAAARRVFHQGDVVAAVARLAQVPHHGVGVILEGWRDGRVRDAVAAVFRIGLGRRHIGLHGEAVQGEVDRGVDLAGGLGLGGGEAFEVDDEHAGQARQRDALGGLALALAVGAFPDFVAAEPFLLAVAAEALVDVAAAGAGDLDADGVEGLVGGGGVAAGGAAQAGGVLAGEEVGDEGVLAVGVAVPFHLGDLGDGQALADEFFLGGEGLQGPALPVGVQVLVEAVDEELEKLFGVLLAVDAPVGLEAGAEVPQGSGTHGAVVVLPEVADEVGVDLGHDAVGAFPVLLSEAVPASVKEKLREGNGGEETLYRGIHVAGHAEVDETCTGELQGVRHRPGGVERELST